MGRMKHSELYALIHSGTVVSVESGKAHVSVDVGAAGHSCAGCALSASCGQDNKNAQSASVVLCARIPSGVELPDIGGIVSVGLPKGRSMRAILTMLVLPLAVFLAIACIGTVAGLDDGPLALYAIAGACICYMIIYLVSKYRPSPWILISDNR